MRWLIVTASVLGLGVAACGGSSSETPFPVEPLPDYLRSKGQASSTEAAPSAATSDSAAGNSAVVTDSEKAEPPHQPEPSTPAREPSKAPAGAPNF